MKRISKATKAIADRHIAAKYTEVWDELPSGIKTKEQLLQLVRDGATYKELISQLEYKFCPVGQIIGSLWWASDNYKQNIYKGFKLLFD